MAETASTSAVRSIREALNQASLVDAEPLLKTLQSASKQAWSEEDIAKLEEECQHVHRSVINQSNTIQFSIFLSILHALKTILPPTSIITTWFELTLRFAFRNVKLERSVKQKARELVLHGLSEGSKSTDFRRRIIDLYLLDVVRDSSGDDALEQVSLDFEEQEGRKCWKFNLEETLTDDALHNPEAFFSQIDEAFQSPPARLQIAVLLSQLARHSNLSMSAFASSPIFSSLLLSLQVDNSTTVCNVGISILIMLLPRLAFEAPRILNESLPRLLLILKRVVCWKVRPIVPNEPAISGSMSDSGSNIQIDANSAFPTELAPNIKWIRLESAFDLTRSSPPDARLYFQFLYGLWPCNTLAFLRRPIKYLQDAGLECPFDEAWEDIIDEDEVHSRAKPILRTHILHPSIILRDSSSELSDLSRWKNDGLDVPGIVSECIVLDVRNAAAAMPRLIPRTEQTPSPMAEQTEDLLGLKSGAPTHQFDSYSSSRAVSRGREERDFQPDPNWPSVHDVIAAQVDLKYPKMDVSSSSPTQLNEDTPRGDRELFTPRARRGDESASPSIPPTPGSPNLQASSPLALPSPLPLTPSLDSHPSPRLHSRLLVSEALKQAKARDASDLSVHAQEAISSLQREVLLLRNELNFELSLKQNHLTHMGKLHRDRVIARGEEAERQNLHNKLKQHKSALAQALEELKTVKAQATAAKFKQNEYISILSDRLAKYREEKQSWLSEAVELRGEVNEAKLMVQKQKAILDDTETERFHLANQLREVLPKMERIHDYEKKIESMTRIQIMWDDSPEMREFRQKKAEMDVMVSNYAKMELTLESLEAANRALEEENSKQRRTMQSLHNHPPASPPSSNNSSPTSSHFHLGHGRPGRSMSISVSQSQVQSMNTSHVRLLALENEHERVKMENIELEEKVEELEAMLEVLKMESATRAPGRRGSVHLGGFSLDPRDLRAGGLGMC